MNCVNVTTIISAAALERREGGGFVVVAVELGKEKQRVERVAFLWAIWSLS